MNRQWFDRAQSEANLLRVYLQIDSSAFYPGSDGGCQEWASRRFEMMAEDGKHLFADAQKFMEAATRLLPNATLIKGSGGSST